jgi:hypothetical protein
MAFGVGAVGFGVGTYFGIRALDQKHESDSICDQSECSPGRSRAVELNDAARSSAWISNVGFAIGIAGGVGGTLLWITDRRDTRQTTLAASLMPGAVRATVRF